MKYLWLIPIALIVGLDQLTKWLASVGLNSVGGDHAVIEGVFHFHYLENTGAAFGMLKDHRWVFMITSTVAIVAIILFMLYKYEAYYNKILYWGLACIAGGGIGNMIDRIALGYVVDFFDFRLINFAIFNVADVFVCIGFGLMVLYLIMDMIKDRKEKKGA